MQVGRCTGARPVAGVSPGAQLVARRLCGCAAATHLRPHLGCPPGAGYPGASIAVSTAAGSQNAVAAVTEAPESLSYAVVGAGLAGVATAWQLLKRTPPGRRVHLHLYDAAGIAAGGSGAAAGLLHPYSPRGKLLWRGREAMDEALALVAAAEAAAAQAAAVDVVPAGGRPGQELSGGRSFVWRHGLVRPAANVKQSADFAKAGQTMAAQPTLAAQGTNAGSFASGSGGRSSTRIRILTAAELETLVPGLNLPAHVANVSAPTPTASPGSTSVEAAPVPAPAPAAATDAAGGNRRARRAAAAAAAATVDPASNAGLLIEAGLVLDVGLYLRGLWLACQAEAEARSDGSTAQLRLQRVASLEHLRPSHAAPALSANDNRSDSSCSGGVRGYDVVVVAAGAAAATIDEVAALGLPLQLCQGLTLVMAPPGGGVRDAAGSGTTGPGADDSGCGAGYPATAPSLLGQPYLAAQSRHRLVVGATKAYGWSAEQALAACGRSEYAEARGGGDVPVAGGLEAQQAVEALRAAACGVWRPLSDWQVDRVREGVRALPPRTQHGSLPLLGRVAPGRPWWLVAGLGSRGLVYHGWLGRLVAEAALGEVLAGSATVGGVGSSTAGGAAGDGESVGQGLQDSGRRRGEAGFPEELTAWRRVAPGAAVFEAP